MPYLVLKRSDIPAGKLQVLDLDPYTSNRSPSIDPPGQTKYVNPVQNDTVALTGAGTITFHREAKGLAAWLATKIDNGGVALTAAQANADATAILALLDFGGAGAAGALDVASVTAAITGTMTTALLPEMMEVIAGREYFVPAGVQVETGGVFAVAAGSKGAPTWGSFRHTYDTSDLTLSFHTGAISKFRSADFLYADTLGQAMVVYNDDGTLYT